MARKPLLLLVLYGRRHTFSGEKKRERENLEYKYKSREQWKFVGEGDAPCA